MPTLNCFIIVYLLSTPFFGGTLSTIVIHFIYFHDVQVSFNSTHPYLLHMLFFCTVLGLFTTATLVIYTKSPHLNFHISCFPVQWSLAVHYQVECRLNLIKDIFKTGQEL